MTTVSLLGIVGPRWLQDWWSTIVAVVGVLLSLIASAHVVLGKRQTRAAIGWIGLIWVAPYLGTALYVLLGINRVRRRAQSLWRRLRRSGPATDLICEPHELLEVLGPAHAHLLPQSRLVESLTHQPLLEGNEIEPLIDGDETFPAMLQAIDGARRSLSLCTYIFYDDPVGRRFVESLRRAVERGVEVRVLIDDVGARYGGWRTIVAPLREAGVPVATFMPTFAPARGMTFFNMRNHRKILVADGRLALTGGMNIDETFLYADRPEHKHHDLHFRVCGPVVSDLQRVFVDDWAFTTDERLQGEAWFPPLDRVGLTPARCIADGPDMYVDRLLMTCIGAVTTAQTSVAIVTPYFLPDEALISAFDVAALRGVEVDIILPSKTNITLVHWASTPLLRRVLEGGCRVWYSPPPFDHTKMMVVDHAWTLIGSANLDPRSLRLNFEANLECYGRHVAEPVERIFLEKKRTARQLTVEDLDRRPLPVKLRDGVARLFSPYL